MDRPSETTTEPPERIAVPVGRFHAWWRGDPLPPLGSPPWLTISRATDPVVIAKITGIDRGEIGQRLDRGHHAWVAQLDGEWVGWGWCAARELEIGELGIARTLPPGQRYLWDFFTNPAWRGKGIYPRLLQTIVVNDRGGERFWIGHDFDNTASARGIAKAGFREVGPVYRRPSGVFVLVPVCEEQVAEACAALFGVSIEKNVSTEASGNAVGR